jgi:hypothetical protein
MLTLGLSHLASLLGPLLLCHVLDAPRECLLCCCDVGRCRRQHQPQRLPLRWQPTEQTHAA